MKDLRRVREIKRLERLTRIESYVCLFLILALSIILGLYIRERKFNIKIKQTKPVVVKCTGYTIIDRDSVIWCDGRRIKYNSHKTLDSLHAFFKRQNR